MILLFLDMKLFEHLHTVWKFTPDKDNPKNTQGIYHLKVPFLFSMIFKAYRDIKPFVDK